MHTKHKTYRTLNNEYGFRSGLRKSSGFGMSEKERLEYEIHVQRLGKFIYCIVHRN